MITTPARGNHLLAVQRSDLQLNHHPGISERFTEVYGFSIFEIIRILKSFRVMEFVNVTGKCSTRKPTKIEMSRLSLSLEISTCAPLNTPSLLPLKTQCSKISERRDWSKRAHPLPATVLVNILPLPVFSYSNLALFSQFRSIPLPGIDVPFHSRYLCAGHMNPEFPWMLNAWISPATTSEHKASTIAFPNCLSLHPDVLNSPQTELDSSKSFDSRRTRANKISLNQSSSRAFRGKVFSNHQVCPGYVALSIFIAPKDLSTSIPCPNQKTLSPLSAQTPYLACWSEILEPQSDTHANFAIHEDLDDKAVSSKLLTNSTLAWILKELLTNSLHAPQQSFSEVTPGLNIVGSLPQGNHAYITTPGKICEATKQARCRTAFNF
ncbi:hypothetical protein VP01_377g7 [Puccinia sorghi]|uniref:Uncharacterized protein n=1 Tax=Puccinia sorghi TaxID=27349 RepID=A0A0L6UTS1_9BASI|nr:hypothetical protein VP01_377g7 [Puccinia sorghi]